MDKYKGRSETINGVSMFVNQAAAQFKLFTGKTADVKLMRKVICDCFSCRQVVKLVQWIKKKSQTINPTKTI